METLLACVDCDRFLPLRALPTRRSSDLRRGLARPGAVRGAGGLQVVRAGADRLLRGFRRRGERRRLVPAPRRDRESTRLSSSHVAISHAVSCLKKKKQVRSMTWTDPILL